MSRLGRLSRRDKPGVTTTEVGSESQTPADQTSVAEETESPGAVTEAKRPELRAGRIPPTTPYGRRLEDIPEGIGTYW